MDRLLVTGAAGRVGRLLLPHLRQRYRLRLLDRVPVPEATPDDEVMTGDLCRAEVAAEAVTGCRGVLDLVCVHGAHLGFEDTLDANYRSLLSLLQACVDGGVERFIYASSHHLIGQHRRDGFDFRDAVIAPDGFYGLSKAFGEAACGMFAKRFGLRALLLRLGNIDPTVSDGRRASLWISGADLAQWVGIGMEHPDIELEVVYGMSQCIDPMFDDPRAAELGYRPRDHAKDHLDPAYVGFDEMKEEDGPDFVGGGYAVSELKRSGA